MQKKQGNIKKLVTCARMVSGHIAVGRAIAAMPV